MDRVSELFLPTDCMGSVESPSCYVKQKRYINRMNNREKKQVHRQNYEISERPEDRAPYRNDRSRIENREREEEVYEDFQGVKGNSKGKEEIERTLLEVIVEIDTGRKA